MTAIIDVEVVYALTHHQTVVAVQLATGATVRDAIIRSGVLDAHPEIALERCELAVWGRKADQNRVLRDRDRVEICRKLIIDPKNARRKRAKHIRD